MESFKGIVEFYWREDEDSFSLRVAETSLGVFITKTATGCFQLESGNSDYYPFFEGLFEKEGYYPTLESAMEAVKEPIVKYYGLKETK
jgi:hypothetical protein